MRRLLVVLLLVFLARPVFAEVEIIPLRHRTVDQILPVLQPLVEPGGAISGMQNQIIIRASSANIADLRRVLASIDTPVRRLLISVRQGRAGGGERRDLSGGATVSAGGGRVSVGEAPRQGGINVRIGETTTREGEQITQQVQTIEGSPAQIRMGTETTLPVQSTTVTPFGTVIQRGVAVREANTGFTVIPRLAGDRVTLEINPQREIPGPGGTVQSQRIVTTASGRLGEWFELGGLTQTQSTQRSGLLADTRELRDDSRSVWVKVDEIRGEEMRVNDLRTDDRRPEERRPEIRRFEERR